jgi:translation initiation factor eIF-2B subunit gamma
VLQASDDDENAMQIVSGASAATSISSWIHTEWAASPHSSGMHCQVIQVPEETGSAEALKSVADRIASSSVVVISGDLVTDVPISALVATHQMSGASATITLVQRKVSPASETKPGKPPKGVDYIGLDMKREHLIFCANSPESLKELKIPLALIRRHGSLHISTDLSDAHLYVFSRELLTKLASNSTLTSLRLDLLPFLTQQQSREANQGPAMPSSLKHASSMMLSSMVGAAEGGRTSDTGTYSVDQLPGADWQDYSHNSIKKDAKKSSGALRVHVVRQGAGFYCCRASDLQSLAEVNRDVADPATALHLSGLKATKYDNIVAASTTMGSKCVVGAACLVGENGVLGDKSSIKRSVLGNGVRVGANSKVVNSILMDGVEIGENCSVQNSLLAAGVTLKDRASVKDCQIGPGFVLGQGIDVKGEILSKVR